MVKLSLTMVPMMPYALLVLAVTHTTQAQHQNPSRPALNPVSASDYSDPSIITSRYHFFDIDLLKSFDDSRNYFVSPASIKATLAMVLEGARGKSADEIATVLGIPKDPSSARENLQKLIYNLNAESTSTLLEHANAVFISNAYELVPGFRKNLMTYYHASVKPLNFGNSQGTAAEINRWVSEATRQHITEIVEPGSISADAALILVNALYFKGKWTHPFDERSTSLKCFRNTRSNCIKTKMMQITKTFRYKAIDDLRAQAVELPYGDGEYAMLVIIPNEKSNVQGLITDLIRIPFSSVVDKLEAVEVQVSLPRFDIQYTVDLVGELQKLNIKEVFGQNANLSGMVQGGQVKINNVMHKATVEVNEKGTVASAVTTIDVIPLMGSSMPRFDADHPFIFFIYHVPTKNIIFEGRFNEPVDAYKDIFGDGKAPQTSKPVHQTTAQAQNVQPSNHKQPQPFASSVDNVPRPLYYPTNPVSGISQPPNSNSPYGHGL